MDKLFLDTNFLLDVAVSGRPESASATKLFELILSNKVIGLVSASSLKDFYYIARRDFDEEVERRWLKLFNKVCYIPAMDQTIVTCALNSDEPDFEDGLLRALAEAEKADFIVSRDAGAFKNSSIKKISAAKYLHK